MHTRSMRPGAACARLLLFVCAAVVAACATLEGGLEPPQVRLTGLSLVEASAASQRFELALEVQNPNPIPFPVEELAVSVRLGGAGLLDGRSSAPFVLPAREAATVRIEVESDIVSSVSRLLSLAQGPNSALAYELNGRVTPARGLRAQIPFSTRGEVPLAVPALR